MSVEKQKIETELKTEVIEAIKLLGQMFQLSVQEFIQKSVQSELDHVKNQLKQNEYDFMEEFFNESEFKKKLLNALMGPEDQNSDLDPNSFSLTKEVYERLIDLCKICQVDPLEKVQELIDTATYSAEIITDRNGQKRVENF